MKGGRSLPSGKDPTGCAQLSEGLRPGGEIASRSTGHADMVERTQTSLMDILTWIQMIEAKLLDLETDDIRDPWLLEKIRKPNQNIQRWLDSHPGGDPDLDQDELSSCFELVLGMDEGLA